MNERDWQRTLETVVKALVAVVVGLLALYLLGLVFTLLGSLLTGIANLILALLRFLVPVAIVAAIVYFAVKALRNRSDEPVPATGATESVVVSPANAQGTTGSAASADASAPSSGSEPPRA